MQLTMAASRPVRDVGAYLDDTQTTLTNYIDQARDTVERMVTAENLDMWVGQVKDMVQQAAECIRDLANKLMEAEPDD